MICKFCGNTIEDNSDFCFICGQRVAPEAAPVETAPAAPVAETPVAEAPVAAPVAEAPVAEAPVAAPVYAQQEAPGVPPAKPVKSKKDKSIASKGCKFFAVIFAATFILQFIPYIWYKKAKKNGYEEKATDILNCYMIGLCIFMGIICFVIAKKYMF